jgi:hypothetical protein
MKHSTSISMPTFCEMSMIAWMSFWCVRAAHDGLTRSLWLLMCSAMIVTSSIARRPAPGSPMSIVSMPRSFASSTRRSLSSIDGSTTDGDWMPSRNVSSRNWIRRFGDSGATFSTEFQS